MRKITLYNAEISATYDGNKVPENVSITPIATLTEAIVCTVREELNGVYELYMEYVVIGVNALEIQADLIVGVFTPMENSIGENYFRIYRVEKDLSGRIYIWARHIMGDLTYIPVRNNTQGTGGRFTDLSGWCMQLREYATSAFPFFIVGEGEVPGSFGYRMPFKSVASVSAYIGGEDLTNPDKPMLELFGGEIVWDQFTLRQMAQRGVKRDIPIQYGVNMDNISIDDDLDGVYTSFILYYADEETQVASDVYSTTYASLFPYARTAMIDWTEFLAGNELTPTQIIAALNSAAATYVANHNEMGNPVRKVEVDVVEANLGEMYLGDSVPVVYYRHGNSINGRMRVVAYEWDVLMQRYNTVTLGAIKSSLAEEIAKASAVENTAKAINSRVGAIAGDVTTLESRVTGVEGGLATVDGRATSLENRATALEQWNNHGYYTGDLNNTNIAAGIWVIGTADSVTNAPSGFAWGNLIQFPGYKGQLLFNSGYLWFRESTGSPASWQPWRQVYPAVQSAAISAYVQSASTNLTQNFVQSPNLTQITNTNANVFAVSGKTIQIKQAGTYMVAAQGILGTGFTTGDQVHYCIYYNSTQLVEFQTRALAGSSWDTISSPPRIFSAAANSTISLYARNETAARGRAWEGTPTRQSILTVIRIN